MVESYYLASRSTIVLVAYCQRRCWDTSCSRRRRGCGWSTRALRGVLLLSSGGVVLASEVKDPRRPRCLQMNLGGEGRS